MTSTTDGPRGEMEALFEAMTAAPDAVIMVDATGRITYWNAGAARIFGYAESEAIGSSLDIIIPERLRARHGEAFTQAVTTGRSRYGPEDLLAVPASTADGRKVSIEFTVSMVRRQGETVRVAAVIREVTERRAREMEMRRRIEELQSAQKLS